MADDDLEVSWRVNEFGRIFLFAGGLPAAAAGHPHPAEVHGRLPPGLLPRVHPDLAREIPRGDLDSPSQILSTRSPAERPRRSKLFCRHETSCAEPWKTQSEGEISIHAFSWNQHFLNLSGASNPRSKNRGKPLELHLPPCHGLPAKTSRGNLLCNQVLLLLFPSIINIPELFQGRTST